MRVLDVLLRRPHQFVSVTELAYHLEQGRTGYLERHRIVQTISGLRQKLNNHGSEAGLLTSRRGLGYTLGSECMSPPSSGDVMSRHTHDLSLLSAHQVRFSEVN